VCIPTDVVLWETASQTVNSSIYSHESRDDSVCPAVMPTSGAILLFYHYERIADLERECTWHLETLTHHDIKGRLRVAPQGLNGTLSGRRSALDSYAAAVTARFAKGGSIDWKVGGARNEELFDTLLVRAVDEVVSLGVPECAAPLEATGRHVSPQEFHAMIEGAVSSASRDVVLLDTRNVYEHRIGRFEAAGIRTLLPPTRQFSDLPAWLQSQKDALAGKVVLMYCTGGVRCESASAYLRNTIGTATDVVQLSGGIERYLEAYPAAAAAAAAAGSGGGGGGGGGGGYFRGKNLCFDKRLTGANVGSSEIIGRCQICEAATDDYSPACRCAHCRLLLLVCTSCAEGKESRAAGTPPLLCEGCQSSCRGEVGSSESAFHPPLRVLCLHGFRQNASALRSRLSQLQRKLKAELTFEFVDAPHTLPQPSGTGAEGESGTSSEGADGRAPNERGQTRLQPQDSGRRRSWLLGDGTCFASHTGDDGWVESLALLRRVLVEDGPYDGVLGFSQGAAVAAAATAALESTEEPLPFRFLMLCSGFVPSPSAGAPATLLDAKALLRCPSLHIIGRADTQVSPSASATLAEHFTDPTIVEHDGGHILPATNRLVQQYKAFLQAVGTSGGGGEMPP
jgi:predicted sulfurtransferase